MPWFVVKHDGQVKAYPMSWEDVQKWGTPYYSYGQTPTEALIRYYADHPETVGSAD
jgi:hypothetical protein